MADNAEEREQVIPIELERLRPFRDHPFKVQKDAEMVDLINSIRQFGILTPLIVRPTKEGFYEIISGHRRCFAARELEYTKVPVIIRVMDYPEAVIAMVDANMNREKILPSEKARAYRIKYEALKYRGGRKKIRGQIDPRYAGKSTLEIVGDMYGESPKQVQRWMKLTKLIPELMEKIDAGKMGFCPASDLADLKPEEQKIVYEAMKYAQASPSISQASRLRQLSLEGRFSKSTTREILSEIKKGEVRRVIFKNEQLYNYFPRNSTPAQMKEEILRILSIWSKENENK